MANIQQKHLFMLTFLVLSFLFVIPHEMGYAYAAEENSGSGGGFLDSRTVERGEVTSVCPGVNVRDSLVMSVVSMCLGGVINKVEEWRQIKCQTVVCHYNAVKNGLDPKFCKKMESYRTCTYIMGELFAIPPMNILEYLRQALARLLANPVGVLWGVGTFAARQHLKSCVSGTGTVACSVYVVGPESLFLAATDILGVAQTLMQMFENGLGGIFGGDDGPDYCEQAMDIREEMQNIVEGKDPGADSSSSDDDGGILGLF